MKQIKQTLTYIPVNQRNDIKCYYSGVDFLFYLKLDINLFFVKRNFSYLTLTKGVRHDRHSLLFLKNSKLPKSCYMRA